MMTYQFVTVLPPLVPAENDQGQVSSRSQARAQSRKAT
jgi:hypothetical protein